jgi:hypothetical protein
MGRPWMSAIGFPGSRVEAIRIGMTTMGFMGKSACPLPRDEASRDDAPCLAEAPTQAISPLWNVAAQPQLRAGDRVWT